MEPHLIRLKFLMPCFTAALIRYFIVGGLAFAVHLVLLESLIGLGLAVPAAASAIGFVFACIVNYTAQHRWVFRSDARHMSAAPRFVVVALAMLGANMVLFILLNSAAGLLPAAAQTVTSGVVFLGNFLLNRSFTFAAGHRLGSVVSIALPPATE